MAKMIRLVLLSCISFYFLMIPASAMMPVATMSSIICNLPVNADTAFLSVNNSGSTIQGSVRYDNAAGTPLGNATVDLKQGNNVLITTITGNDGTYSFQNVLPGSYVIKVTPAHPWGGVNNTDALIILKNYLGLVTLTGLKLLAADVNNSGYVNCTDAMVTQKRFLGITTSFAAGDWLFESPVLTLTEPSVQTVDIKGICAGDVNGSYVPSVQTFTTCGSSFTDFRDGQVYTTVMIINQCWMKQNMNLGTMIPGASNQTDNGVAEKYCYNDDPANCLIYGGLYQWDELMQYSTNQSARGICPEGWHIPSFNEWENLVVNFGGVDHCGGHMKTTGLTYWMAPNSGATNASGFSARGAGIRESYGPFSYLKGYTYLASSNNGGDGYCFDMVLTTSGPDLFYYDIDRTYGTSVRCLKD
ncbi:MAG: carboxypeptidase regulatory-like domain-containing protein [Bacteroidetes bacterium]|nr:carboxypeptidase regulatory-like domain-containing protein [Bacteroidota bacterium]